MEKQDIRELLASIGLTQNEIDRFFRHGEEDNRRAQERLLRTYRAKILDEIHSGEKLIYKLDYLLRELKGGHV